MTSPLADLRRSQDRDYASVGVAMLLTLRSEVAPIPDPPVAEKNRLLAGLVESYAGALGVTGGDDGGVIGVLQAVALRDFDHAVISAEVHHGPDVP